MQFVPAFGVVSLLADFAYERARAEVGARDDEADFRFWEPPQFPPGGPTGVHDEMIPVANSHWRSANLPIAVLLTCPDSRHGTLFRFHESFTRQAAPFLAADSPFALY